MSHFHGVLAAAMLVATGCAARSAGSRPDDMSAARHRQVAARHQAEADRHEDLYDPNATETHVGGGRQSDSGAGQTTVNPTEEHHEEAEAHREHAQQHEQAARELEHFEAAECRSIPPAERAACPLLTGVASVENIDGGVLIRLAEGVTGSAVAARMSCHFAFARTRGYQGMSECPLYLRGVQAQPRGEHGVAMTASDPAVVPELRRRVRAHTTQ